MKCLILEINLNNKKGHVVSPSQATVEFNLFFTILENLLTNISSCDPHFTSILGDFNVKSKSWSINGQPTIEGTQLESLTSLYGMKQLII